MRRIAISSLQGQLQTIGILVWRGQEQPPVHVRSETIGGNVFMPVELETTGRALLEECGRRPSIFLRNKRRPYSLASADVPTQSKRRLLRSI